MPGSEKKKILKEKSDVEMHRTDAVPKLARRQSMSLVARSKKLKSISPLARS